MGPSPKSHTGRDILSSKSGYPFGMSKVMVSLPEDLLQDLDAEARRRATSRSALLALAARRELLRHDPEAVAEAVARSERRFEGAGSFDAAELIRGDRSARQ